MLIVISLKSLKMIYFFNKNKSGFMDYQLIELNT